MVRRFLRVLAVPAFLVTVAAPSLVHAQSRQSLTKEAFAFPAAGQIRVVLFRPDVSVGEQSTGGLDQPNAGWTEQARDQLTAALGKAQAERNIELKLMPELTGENAKLMSDYRKLFKIVADSVIKHRLFALDPLPTKEEKFDWTLGEGASQLGTLGGGDYGLFFYTLDSYESGSRKMARLLASQMGAERPNETNMGYAGLVDLKTGDLVWINVDVKMAGDVRTLEGASLRITELLDGFPVRAGLAPTKVKK
ncbi:MAG: hypothetical protein ABL928_00155 [Sphingorhabdus sp.]